ncbi:MAG TPA: hypothetical protein DDW42_09285 [Desulfobacteraceae bacterium]|nr:hypothetical protein [Desulfobacteraceae bacterium]
MFRPKMLIFKYLTGIYLFILSAIIFYPATSWSQVAKVDIIQSQDQYHAGGAYRILFQIRISSPWYIHGTKKNVTGLVPTVISFPESPDIEVDDIQFPSPLKKDFEYTKEQVEVFSGQIQVQAKLVVTKHARKGKYKIKGNLSYQACSSHSCLPPEKVPIPLFIVIAPQEAQIKLQNQEIFSSEHRASSHHGPASGWKFSSSLWLRLLGILIGGLLLNLTPCIYPLIPITVSYFGGKSEKIKGRPFVHGLLYICGLAFTNSTLGLIAGLTGGMLGSVLQNPIVLIAVSGILVLLALSFFGLWEFRLPSGLTRLASRNYGGYFGTFFMGLTLGIVAAPCLGPFVLGLLTYVGQQGDPFLGFLYFFVLSIGMGLPLAVLAMLSGTIEKLPVSGQWMTWVRKVLGWVLVGMAGYLLQPLISYPIAKTALFASIAVLAAVHLWWLDGSRGNMRGFLFVKRGIGLILIVGAIIFFMTAYKTTAGVHWIPYDRTVLMQAVKANRPVVLDFYADWCGPCVAMKKKVFRNPDVVKLSHDFVTLRIDLTKQHPHQAELQRLYQIRGVPTIIFINRQGIEERELRIESFAGSDQVLDRMRRLLEKPK